MKKRFEVDTKIFRWLGTCYFFTLNNVVSVPQWKLSYFFLLCTFSKEKAVKRWKQFAVYLNFLITHYCYSKFIFYFGIALYWSATFKCFCTIRLTDIFEIHFTLEQFKVLLPGEETIYLNKHLRYETLFFICKIISVTEFEIIYEISKSLPTWSRNTLFLISSTVRIKAFIDSAKSISCALTTGDFRN